MSSRRRIRAWGRKGSATSAIMAMAMAAPLYIAAPAAANIGYEPSTTKHELPTGAEFLHGVAINQTSHEIYVAVIAETQTEMGEILRLKPDGTITGSFGATASSVFSGVAVNQLTQGFFGAEVVLRPPTGPVGTARIDVFSSAGALGTTFPTSDTEGAPQIAVDSSGLVYFPNAVTNSVQVFNSAGTLQESIVCTGCPGGAFGQPMSVALDSDGDLYVVDIAPDRVLKFSDSGSGYAFASILQSGRGASGVGVDPSTDDVFVTDVPSGGKTHIVAYDSSGAQFDDFGAGLATSAFPQNPVVTGPQVAADATSHKLYVSSQNELLVFDRVTISPPVVTTGAASKVGQQVATLSATVNAKGHAILACDFEYVNDTEFLAQGFASPSTVPCSTKPDGTLSVAVDGSVSRLSPGTKYHFRAVATSNAGTTTGATGTFTTLPSVPPTVTTDPATAVTDTGATLVGRVNPQGGTVTDCRFEYGTTSSYGSSVACPSKPGPGTTEVSQKASLNGLASGTGYHYRLVVTTNAGTTEGGDVTFTTASPPPPPEPAPPTPPTPPEATAPPTGPIVGPALSCKPGFVKVKRGGKAICVKRCRKGFVRKKVKGKFKCVRRQPRRRAGRR